MYQVHSEGNRGFTLLHCYSKLKTYEKWRLTRIISLAKGKDGLIDLYAPLVASAGCPIGNKVAKAAAFETIAADKI
jgi:hypothetical protein